jgi:uncharacterized protein YndB with AHSA1/START domain
MGAATNTDRIEKETVLQAPRSRVWEAIGDSARFGAWFGMAMDRPFAPGAHVVATMHGGEYDGLSGDFWIEEVVPGTRLSFRWHPYAVERGVDYSNEPTTLVVMELEDAPGGTRLRVIESGFDALPPSRRDLAFRMNEEGWAIQVGNIQAYVAR